MSQRQNRDLENRTADEIAAEYEPDAEVRALLASHGVNIAPAGERAGQHDINWQGRGFVLPAEPSPMTLRESSEVLRRKADEEEQEITVSEIIDALPWDGAQAFAQAIQSLYGWGIMQAKRGFFGMKIPPVVRSIKTGPGPKDTIQVFWGDTYIPQMDAVLTTSAAMKDGRYVFQIGGEIRKNQRHNLETLVALTRIYANTKSIYKGKAIRMFVDERGNLNPDKEPEFLKLSDETIRDLIFSEDVKQQIETNLFAPIQYPDACRDLKIPLKRGILLEGRYGVGKSMTATATAKLAIDNGWTFIMLDRVAGLKQVLDFAHRYAPVVVFAEDIDRVIAGDDRTVSIDDVLNTLDGVQGKNHELITVLTTNHADKINRAMLRPGRLDAIVTVTPPDADAAQKLMRLYGRGLIDPTESLVEAGKALAGQIPAVIREAVERAKLAAIAREGGVPTKLVDNDLVVAAGTMKAHLDLMQGHKEEPKSHAQIIGEAFLAEMKSSADGALRHVSDTVDEIEETTDSTQAKVNRIARAVGAA